MESSFFYSTPNSPSRTLEHGTPPTTYPRFLLDQHSGVFSHVSPPPSPMHRSSRPVFLPSERRTSLSVRSSPPTITSFEVEEGNISPPRNSVEDHSHDVASTSSQITEMAITAFNECIQQISALKNVQFLPQRNPKMMRAPNLEALIVLATCSDENKKIVLFPKIYTDSLKKINMLVHRQAYSYVAVGILSVANYIVPKIMEEMSNSPWQWFIGSACSMLTFGAACTVATGVRPLQGERARALDAVTKRYWSIARSLKELRSIQHVFACRIAENIKKNRNIICKNLEDPIYGLNTDEVEAIWYPLKEAIDYTLKEDLTSTEMWYHLPKRRWIEALRIHDGKFHMSEEPKEIKIRKKVTFPLREEKVS